MTSVGTPSLHCWRTSFGRGVLLVVLLLIATTGFGHTRARPRHDERQQIERMEEQMRQAELAADVGVLDRLLSDDYVGISMSGEVNTKAQKLERLRSHTLVLTGIHLDEVKIRLLGQVAVVTSRAKIEGTTEGRSLAGTYRYTRVYLQGAGNTWKVTNFEVTRISA